LDQIYSVCVEPDPEKMAETKQLIFSKAKYIISSNLVIDNYSNGVKNRCAQL